MNESQIPAPDADSSHDTDIASVPSYPQRAMAQDHSATQELPTAQDATREMPTPSAEETREGGGAYSAPTGEPYGGYAAPASPEVAVAPTVVVTKKGPGWVALFGAMLLTIGLTLGAVFFARPAMLRASTPTNLNGGTVTAVPASNSSGTDWTDVASAVSPAVVTIQTQGASSGG
ncbi:MAG: trypsin, partial [Actinomyces sp.]|nr:trypsin [Actinomyces sp.]